MRVALALRRLCAAGATGLALGGCTLFGGSQTTPAPAQEAPRTAMAPVLNKIERPTSEEIVDRVICIVNNDAITEYELEEAEAYHYYESKEQPAQGAGRTALRQRILDRIIENRLQVQQAEREKLAVEDAELAEAFADVMKKMGAANEAQLADIAKRHGVTVDTLKRRIREQILVQKLIRRRVASRISVTEAEVDRYFRENREKLEIGLGFEARHMLFLPEAGRGEDGWTAAHARAEAAWNRIAAGADFADLAREFSDDPSGKDGGALGSLKRGELAADIEAAILALEPGEVSKPFRSRVGYHLFRLDSREALSGDALAQARNQIRDILYREKYQARLRDWVREIRERAIVETRL